MNVVAPSLIRESKDILFLCPSFRARRQLHIDLRSVTWVSPLGVVAILSACLSAEERNLEVSVSLPTNRVVRTYLDRIGFYGELEGQGWGSVGNLDIDESYSVAGCLPVQPLLTEFEVEQASHRLADALKTVPVVEGLLSQIMTVAVELTQNAREHGSRCYVVAQTHTGATTGTAGVHVAVADFGPGFAATLRSEQGALSDDAAILRAFQYGVSGRPEPGRGMGLGYVLDDIDGHTGSRLQLVSRKAHVLRHQGEFEVSLCDEYRGTLAAAFFPYLPAKL